MKVSGLNILTNRTSVVITWRVFTELGRKFHTLFIYYKAAYPSCRAV